MNFIAFSGNLDPPAKMSHISESFQKINVRFSAIRYSYYINFLYSFLNRLCFIKDNERDKKIPTVPDLLGRIPQRDNRQGVEAPDEPTVCSGET